MFVVLGRQNAAVRQYHVLFFGDEGERGWVLETTSLPYSGRAAFDCHCQSMIARLPTKDRKNYVVASNRRRAWEVAVSSAEHAWMLSHEQRIDEFIPPMSSAGHGFTSNPISNSWFSSASGFSLELASCDSTDTLERHSNSSSTILSNSSGRNLKDPLCNVTQEQFDAFCRHSRKSLCLMHPGFTAEQIDRLLQMQWSELDAAEKSKYSGWYMLCYC